MEGKTVRVVRADKTAGRALVLCVNGGTKPTYDVLMTDTEEEATVPADRVVPLLDFEYSQGKSLGPEDTNQKAGELFRIGDYKAASEMYERALHELVPDLRKGSTPQIPRIGSVVLVKNTPQLVNVHKDPSFRPLLAALVSDVNEKQRTIEVVYLSDDNEDSDVSIDTQVVPIAQEPSSMDLQCRLYLNLCRCEQRFENHTRALAFAQRAVGLSPHLPEPSLPRTTTALFLRAKCYLSLKRFALAERDTQQVVDLDKSNKEAKALLKKIDKAYADEKRSNQVLVREMAKWVQSSVGEE
eukprot:c26244_g1_i1.p1 GENE.c26244_g1_i1~~c26244_g1_i1.p1  ORF type:complete len:298 (-),score=81.35 c26244_g1_i1:128-1021(-)